MDTDEPDDAEGHGATDDKLVFNKDAYRLFHKFEGSAPSLSFDIIRDSFGDNRETMPLTVYIVAGTQAKAKQPNCVSVMKLSNVIGVRSDGAESNSDSSEDESDDNEPELEAAHIRHRGGVNRVRFSALNGVPLAATWSEKGVVSIWNLSHALAAVNDPVLLSQYTAGEEEKKQNAMFSFSGHMQEGFALDWSPTVPGRLASGDCARRIHIWEPQDGASSWTVDQRSLQGHTNSVEDIQWSPSEAFVLASCSADRSIRIWDIRAAFHKACMITIQDAHGRDSDVNVLSWNHSEPFIASGGDDGSLKIWDLRQVQTAAQTRTPAKDTNNRVLSAASGGAQAVATLKQHSGPITSVEWCPTDSATLACCAEDDQLTIWDLSVERDAAADQPADRTADEPPDLPPQLLFTHQGQQEMKELHWHPQCPGLIISTALSGFDIFRTISA